MPRFRPALRAALTLIALLPAGAAGEPAGPATQPEYRLKEAPPDRGPDPLLAGPPALDRYTLDAIRSRVPGTFGGTARLMPVDDLYFLPGTNIADMDTLWAAEQDSRPSCIVLGPGSHGLESIRRQVGEPAVLARAPDGSFLLSRPLYVGPAATLALSHDRLKLSIRGGVFIYSNGELVVADSEILAWDPVENRYAERQALSKKRALYYLEQSPRPYLLAAQGSRTYVGGSRLRGLGYKGTSGTFGISLTPNASSARLGAYLARLAQPTGWLVGNDVEELFFGFYSHRALDVAIVGNAFRDNVVYGVDPHDFSERLTVARNVAADSRLAHGIIFSRGVRDSWILENVTVGNAGSGVMLDRDSTDNRIVDNLVVGNAGDGIAVFESSRNVLSGNAVQRNRRNGIYVRNSEDVTIERNEIVRNGASGVEIAAVDITGHETRDFELDPYRQRVTADVSRNTFVDNVRSAIKARAPDVLRLDANRYVASGPAYFTGDLAPHAGTLLGNELQRRRRTVIERTPAVAAPPPRDPSPTTAGTAVEVIRQHAERGSARAILSLARLHAARPWHDADTRRETIYWYGRAIRHGRTRAMTELATLLLAQAGREAERHEAEVLLALAAVLGDVRARQDLALLPVLFETTEAALARAEREARERVRKRRLWNDVLFPDIEIRLSGKEGADAFKRRRRLADAVARGLAPAAREADLAPAPRLDAERRAAYLERARTRNSVRELFHERLEAERDAEAQAVGAARARLDRTARRGRGATLQVATLPQAERDALREEIERFVARINRHRDAAAALDAAGLMRGVVR